MKEKIIEWLDLLINAKENAILKDDEGNWISCWCSLCGYSDEIHISNIFDVADALNIPVEIHKIKNADSSLPYRATFRYKNYKFFTLLTEKEISRGMNNENE